MARRAFSRSCSNRSIRFWSRLFLKRDCSTCRWRWRFSSSNCLNRSCSLGVRRGACIGKLRIKQVRANVQQILLRLPGPRRFTQRPARKSLLTKYFTPVDNYVRSGSRDHLDDFYLGSKVKVLKECEQER